MEENMKKLFKYCILFSPLFFLLQSCENNNDLKDLGLFGKVKSLKETSFMVNQKFGNIEKGIRSRVDYEFEDTYSSNELEFMYTKEKDFFMTFNENGFILEENQFESNGNLYFKYIYTYDETNSKLLNIHRYFNDGSLDAKFTYQYNSKNIICEIGVDSYENIFSKEDYIYDSNDFLIESNYYENGNYKIYNKKYTNNSKGLVIEENEYNPNGQLNCKFIYTYDENDNPIKIIRISNNNSYYYWECIYDSNNNITEIKRFNSTLNEFDLNQKYKYEYDSKNNWIKEIIKK